MLVDYELPYGVDPSARFQTVVRSSVEAAPEARGGRDRVRACAASRSQALAYTPRPGRIGRTTPRTLRRVRPHARPIRGGRDRAIRNHLRNARSGPRGWRRLPRSSGSRRRRSLRELLQRSPVPLVHRREALIQRWPLARTNGPNLEALSVGRDLERRFGRDVQDLQDGLVDDDAIGSSGGDARPPSRWSGGAAAPITGAWIGNPRAAPVKGAAAAPRRRSAHPCRACCSERASGMPSPPSSWGTHRARRERR